MFLGFQPHCFGPPSVSESIITEALQKSEEATGAEWEAAADVHLAELEQTRDRVRKLMDRRAEGASSIEPFYQGNIISSDQSFLFTSKEGGYLEVEVCHPLNTLYVIDVTTNR